jgi:lipid-A-disaccharide synthase
LNYFFSTGEPSGESSAVLLAQAIASIDREAHFEGIGAQRMRDAGFRLWRDHTGWASMGPLAAIPRIPKQLAIMWRTAFHIAARKPDLVVLVDYGVFNLRLASTLRRRLGYAGPILDLFPPGAWLDNERKAREVSSLCVPLVVFAHQRAFYRQLGLNVAYFGHPLAAQYEQRSRRDAPPSDAGIVAILPGSRRGELRFHLPVLAQAYRALRARRPRLRAIVGAADEHCARDIARAVERYELAGVQIVRGVSAAVADADAAWVASGTAVLECALSGVPAVALYVITPLLVKHGRKLIKHRFITLPNLILSRELIPELLQEDATPARLADEMERLLSDPSRQYASFSELRSALGAPDALQQCAQFAVELARGTR